MRYVNIFTYLILALIDLKKRPTDGWPRSADVSMLCWDVYSVALAMSLNAITEPHQIQIGVIAFLSSLLSLNNKQSKSGSGSNRRLAQEFIMAILQPPV